MRVGTMTYQVWCECCGKGPIPAEQFEGTRVALWVCPSPNPQDLNYTSSVADYCAECVQDHLILSHKREIK